MRRPPLLALPLGLALLTAGCPGQGSATTTKIESLSLRFQDAGAVPRVGERKPLVVTYGGPQGGALMGAVILDPPSGLTRWHADPADAVSFDGNGSAATFLKPGKVKIWASTTSEGGDVQSNALEVDVAAGS